MTRSPAIRRAVGTWIAIASAVIIAGCVRGVEIDPAMVYSGAWNADLPPGVSSDPATFRARIAGIKPVGPLHTRLRAAAGCSRCAVNVTIQAIAVTRGIDPDRPPRDGLAVAHIRNLDSTRTEAYYGFRPATQADYYFWVDRRPSIDSSRITILEVPTGRGTVRAGRQKNLAVCHSYSIHPLPADADFVEYTPDGSCGRYSSAVKSQIAEASLFSTFIFARFFARIAGALGMLTSAGGWIDCNSGCCT